VTFNYRYSIIPAGAITDGSLEPRDLQVLCLLGRHTRDNGWCFRSQVRMARELRCGRASLQRSIERLVEARWLEKKLMGRDGNEPDPEKHPSSIYAYRVCLDRDDVIVPPEGEDDVSDDEQGVPTGGHGGAQPERARGAHVCTGTMKVQSEGSLQEQVERETRAREPAAKRLSQIKAVWPTTAIDDQERTDREWLALPDEQQQLAVDRAQQFLEELRRHKRTAVPALWNYLTQRRWNFLKAMADQEAKPIVTPSVSIEEGSENWTAWEICYRLCGHVGVPSFRIALVNGKRVASLPSEWPPVGRGLDPDRTKWVQVVEGAGDGHFPAWLRRLQELPNANIGTKTVVVDGRPKRMLLVPPTETGFPPPKGDATGPPHPGELNERDAQDFTG
jgi:hypothetical protein